VQSTVDPRSNRNPARRISRRGFLIAAGSTTTVVLLAACKGSSAPAGPAPSSR